MRPKIICHMITSIDGRLLTGRLEAPVGVTDRDALIWSSYEGAEARLPHDGWMAGRRTLERYATGQTTHDLVPPMERDDLVGDAGKRKIGVLFDPSGRLDMARDSLPDHLVYVFSTRVPQAHVEKVCATGASCIFAGTDGYDIASVLPKLRDYFGSASLLLEGGGRLNGAFLQAGLIDETSTLIMPAVDGLAGVHAIYDYPGASGERPAAGQPMRLLAVETLEGGVVWLRHVIERR